MLTSFEVIAACKNKAHIDKIPCQDCMELRASIPSGNSENVQTFSGFSSMGEVYNYAVSDDHAYKDVLIFTHTDVRVLASQSVWDNLLRWCSLPDVGFVGVAGSTQLGSDGIWWNCPEEERGKSQRGAVQHVLKNSSLRGYLNQALDAMHYPTVFGPYGQVVVLDGVFLAIERQKLLQLGPWHEDLGWHFYDVDMTLRAHNAGFKNYAEMIPILHARSDMPNDYYEADWQDKRQRFLHKAEGLPVHITV